MFFDGIFSKSENNKKGAVLSKSENKQTNRYPPANPTRQRLGEAFHEDLGIAALEEDRTLHLPILILIF